MTVFVCFHLFFSLCLLFCLPRNASSSVFYYLAILGNPCKTYQQQSVGKRWNESPFLCRQSCWHIRTRSRAWPFWKFWQDIGLHSEGAPRSVEGNQDESSALAIQCEMPHATRLCYHGICTILTLTRAGFFGAPVGRGGWGAGWGGGEGGGGGGEGGWVGHKTCSPSQNLLK